MENGISYQFHMEKEKLRLMYSRKEKYQISLGKLNMT